MILIADSGSTKTDWRTIDPRGQVSQARTIGFNPYYQDSAAIATELQTNLLPAVQETVTDVFYYGTGCNSEESCGVVEKAIRTVFPAVKTVEVSSDLLGAARALCGHETGIACILGTGSNACLYDGRDIAQLSGTLGFWLGDEGSGGYLGKTLVTRFLHGQLPQELADKFQKRYPKVDRLTVLDHAYKQPFPNRYFAGFSKFLFDNRSHPVAYQIVYDAFSLFFDTYIRKFSDSEQTPIHFVGSVAFYYSDILRQVANDKGLTVRRILETPIAGLTLYHQDAESLSSET
ncbi:N-acetylglucosamine kinase-like BadF-type ATPase [Larkinella arboricola]|uniref:N-acetylglucosamine kinase-like BadF-type ATPase n=1 Tax=Larkinella arboricola TaxID=643671 RepID=A0A327X4C2_LARAB|nr:N-acetylglucosamine kinase [Larkinella arboricola]RAJ97768.1 N-acetylglucosamine kinase-like BadF-type ATPase [Larkinella arboricola]